MKKSILQKIIREELLRQINESNAITAGAVKTTLLKKIRESFENGPEDRDLDIIEALVEKLHGFASKARNESVILEKKEKLTECPQCKSKEFREDDTHQISTCTNCGRKHLLTADKKKPE